MSDSAATMFLAFLLELDKFTLAMLMVDIEATMASLVTLTHRETTFSKFLTP